MNHRERVLATLQRRRPGVLCSYEGFMDIDAQRKLMPELDEMDPLEAQFSTMETFGCSMMSISVGQPYSDESEIVEEDQDHRVTRNKMGQVAYQRFNPAFYKVLRWPVESVEDLDKIQMPDPDVLVDSAQKRHIFEEGRKRGYYIQAKLPGFFAGTWYILRPLTDFLEDLVVRPEFAEKLIAAVGNWQLGVAEQLLQMGVDGLHMSEDMGCTSHPWFSPAVYERFFFPWHKKYADLAHRYNGYAHMHSHGYIMPFMDKIVQSGIDILNPVGPGDNMDLAKLKKDYGDKIILIGGLSKFIGQMSRSEIDEHIEQVLRVGTEGGGFMSGNEGGVPVDFSHDDFRFYLDTHRKYREKYGNCGS